MIVFIATCAENITVTGLNPADGSLAWRYEHPWPRSRFPRLTLIPSYDRSAVRLRLHGGRGQLILDQATGKVVGKRPDELGTYFDRFSADAYLAWPAYEDNRVEFQWRAFAGGRPKTASIASPDLSDAPAGLHDYLPLADSMFMAEITASTRDTVSVAARLVPWDATGDTEIRFDMAGRFAEHPSVDFALTEGAPLVLVSGASTIVGLN